MSTTLPTAGPRRSYRSSQPLGRRVLSDAVLEASLPALPAQIVLRAVQAALAASVALAAASDVRACAASAHHEHSLM
jgi:hypothetical protein